MHGVPWTVLFHADFEAEFRELPEAIQDELLKRLRVLGEFGPTLGRPKVDTLDGSSFPNIKELRFRLDGLWRFAFALIHNDKPSCLLVAIKRARVRVLSIQN